MQRRRLEKVHAHAERVDCDGRAIGPRVYPRGHLELAVGRAVPRDRACVDAAHGEHLYLVVPRVDDKDAAVRVDGDVPHVRQDGAGHARVKGANI